MSAIPGTREHYCDRCGNSVDNGGVDKCIVVSDLDPYQPGMVRNLHFCRRQEGWEEDRVSCAEVMITPDNLEWYLDKKKKEEHGNSKPGKRGVDDGGSTKTKS